MSAAQKKKAETQYQQRVEGVGTFTVSKAGKGKFILSGLVVKPIWLEGTPKEMAEAVYRLGDYMWFPANHPKTDHDHRVLDSMSCFLLNVGETFPEIETEIEILEENA